MTQSLPQILSICVYCGSSPGSNPEIVKAAHTLGTNMAEAGIGLVYGGGHSGVMGAVAKAVLESGGSVTGIIPEFLMQWEQNQGADWLDAAEMIVVPDMHTRKHMMFEKADAFVALPGGIGTLEELTEIMTWAQLKRHTKPMALLNIDDFWSPLIDLIEHMTEQGFLHNPELTELRIATRAEDVVSVLSRTES